ncbi:hypothetical protein GCM10009801_57720 [Streptomyces albiaxialis]|uniref:Endonuclease/exonuclease/phosphatase domain-containing protein n=2 Tax=Streptomyces albiaxialis TaxID=329523 RepID=A0ABN2WG64_9ACTN
MEGELGPGKHATAVYWRSDTFKKTETWDTDWPGFWLHPTAVTLRLRDAEDIEVVCGSAHLSYAACTDRAGEAENLLRLPDRVHTPDDEQRRKAPVLALGLDGNSYADETGRVPGEPGAPRPEQIKDVQHLAHRSRHAPSGERIMDCEPHRILTGGGLTDTARFHAHHSGQADPVAATSEAKPAQGPATRIDFLFTSGLLASALTRVEVVPMTGLSDHHTVLAEWDLTLLIEICRDHFGLAA